MSPNQFYIQSVWLCTYHDMNTKNLTPFYSEGGLSFLDHQGELILVEGTHSTPPPGTRKGIERHGRVNQ